MLTRGWVAVASVLLALAAAGCGGTTVSQVAGPDTVRCQIELSSASTNAPAGGTRVDLVVTAARDCTWSSTSEASWVQVSPPSGQGEGTVGVNVSSNSQQATRATNVRVNDATFRVTQAAAAPPLPPCTYRLDPTSRNIGDNGGTRTVRVETAAHCAWTASSNMDWVTFESPTTGTGTATLTYRVARHTGSNVRVALLTIGGQVHVVRQDD